MTYHPSKVRRLLSCIIMRTTHHSAISSDAKYVAECVLSSPYYVTVDIGNITPLSSLSNAKDDLLDLWHLNTTYIFTEWAFLCVEKQNQCQKFEYHLSFRLLTYAPPVHSLTCDLNNCDIDIYIWNWSTHRTPNTWKYLRSLGNPASLSEIKQGVELFLSLNIRDLFNKEKWSVLRFYTYWCTNLCT